MFKNLNSFGIIFLTTILISGCVATETPSSSLAINSPSAVAGPVETEVANADLPMEGPAPQNRPDILALASGENSDPVVSTAAENPAEMQAMLEPTTPKKIPTPEIAASAQPVVATNRERDCLMRTMYFESNRSSPDGLLAVGTVVMHRLAHGAWGNSVCSVVQARNQFAPGLMTRKMQGNLSDLEALADKILAGKRHPQLPKNVMYFHVAGMKFPYKNMRYVLVAGGNTFYYKASRKRAT